MRLLRKGLFKARAGNTAMIFALLAPVLVLMGGGVVDLTNASMRQSNLQQAADATAVGVVARNSPAFQAALLMTGDGTVTASNLQPNAQAIFSANRRNSGDTTTPNLNVAVTKAGLVVSSTVTATSTFSPSFLRLLSLVGLNQMSAIKLSVTANAADNIPAFINFYLLLDNTPSQGVAATTAGITALQNYTGGCAFACHDLNNANSNYNIAKSYGIATRINNVAAAASNLLSTAQSTENANGVPAEFQVALFDYGPFANNPATTTPLTQVYPQVSNQQFGTTSSDLTSASKAAAAIDLMTVTGRDIYGDTDNDQYHDEDTNLASPLSFAAQNLTTSGSGSSASSPQQVLFMVSDGMTDTYNCAYNDDGANDCREIRPMDTSACTTLKNNGVKIAILYTTYLPLPADPWFNQHVAWLTNTQSNGTTLISAAMQSCATPGFYFEVNSGQDINAAMTALFQKVVASVKITG